MNNAKWRLIILILITGPIILNLALAYFIPLMYQDFLPAISVMQIIAWILALIISRKKIKTDGDDFTCE